MQPGILVDLNRCAGCGSCALACREINELPADAPDDRLSATSWTFIERRGGLSIKRQCMHCLNPACASVCPVGALRKSDEGPVVYNERLCMGCRYCMIACPFGVPAYEWDGTEPRVRKCIMCWEKRIQKGGEPACTSTCPTGALRFGEREELISEAQRRIRDKPEAYVNQVYGLREAGGTSVLYLSPVPFATIGFPNVHKDTEYPGMTWAILDKLPAALTVGGALLAGVWWLTGRREIMEQVRSGEITMDEAMRRRPPVTGDAADEEVES